jgi:hypothetical protein
LIQPNIGPNRFHQNRTVSWLMSIPRVHHHDQTNDFWRAVEIPERVAHGSKLPQPEKAQEIGLTKPSKGIARTSRRCLIIIVNPVESA